MVLPGYDDERRGHAQRDHDLRPAPSVRNRSTPHAVSDGYDGQPCPTLGRGDGAAVEPAREKEKGDPTTRTFIPS